MRNLQLRPQQGGMRDTVFEQGRVPSSADRLGPRFGLRSSGLLEKASKGRLVRSGWGWVLILLKKPNNIAGARGSEVGCRGSFITFKKFPPPSFPPPN